MKILITGATGSIGKLLTKSLVNEGFPLAAVVRGLDKTSSVFSEEDIKNITIIDVYSEGWDNKIVEFNPEVVVHLAAFLTSRDDLDIIPNLIESNIAFGTQILQVLKSTDFKYFINTGTFAEYFFGDGSHNSSYLYSATKTAFHSILKYYQQLNDFKIFNIIPYTVYGQIDEQPKIIDIIYNSFFGKSPSAMSGGEQNLDFIHVKDVVYFYTLLIKRCSSISSAWEDYHLGTGKGSTLRNIAKILSNELNMPENINWGALPYRPRDTMYSVAPIAKMLRHFGWSPTIHIEQGVQKFIAEKKKATF